MRLGAMISVSCQPQHRITNLVKTSSVTLLPAEQLCKQVCLLLPSNKCAFREPIWGEIRQVGLAARLRKSGLQRHEFTEFRVIDHFLTG